MPDQPSLGIPQAQQSSSESAQRPADALALPTNPVDLHTAGGSAVREGAPLELNFAEDIDNAASQSDHVNASLKHVAAHEAPGCNVMKTQMADTGAGLSEQGASRQALHFAHDVLGNALLGLPWHSMQLWGCLVTSAPDSPDAEQCCCTLL